MVTRNRVARIVAATPAIAAIVVIRLPRLPFGSKKIGLLLMNAG
jgi:hypothetical protein